MSDNHLVSIQNRLNVVGDTSARAHASAESAHYRVTELSREIIENKDAIKNNEKEVESLKEAVRSITKFEEKFNELMRFLKRAGAIGVILGTIVVTVFKGMDPQDIKAILRAFIP